MTHTPAELRNMCQQPLKINELTYLGTVASKHMPVLLDEVERLREALGFYAEPDNFIYMDTDPYHGVYEYGEQNLHLTQYQKIGQRARAALQPDLMGEKDE